MEAETVIFTNSLGVITNRRVILNHKYGAEDIPIGIIDSVSFDRRRNYFFAVGSCLAIYFLASMLYYNSEFSPLFFNVILSVGIVYFILTGIAHWIGHHLITVGTSGKKPRSLKVEMARKAEGKRLVDAIRLILLERNR